MDSNLEAVLAAFPENASETEAAPVAAETPETTEAEAPEAETSQEPSENEELRNKPDSELTPEQLEKRERNRESHLKSALARRKRAEDARELRELREFKAKMEAAQQTANREPQEPNLDNYDDIGLYTKDMIAYEKQKDLAAQNKNQVDPVIAQRAQEAIAREAEFAKAAPDYQKLVGENADFFQEVGNDPKLRDAILEAENAPLALYALMKEGLIDELYNLSPTRLAAELAKAEIRGQSYLVQKKTISTAPQPLAVAKGTGLTTKPVSSMSFEELKKDLGIK